MGGLLGRGGGMFLCGGKGSRPLYDKSWSMYIMCNIHTYIQPSARTAESGGGKEGERGWVAQAPNALSKSWIGPSRIYCS